MLALNKGCIRENSKYGWKKTRKMRVVEKMSTHLVKPVLVQFLFAEIYPYVDSFADFCYEPKHNLSLGVSRMLKEFLRNILNDDNRITDTSETDCQTYRTVEEVRLAFFPTVNLFLANLQ